MTRFAIALAAFAALLSSLHGCGGDADADGEPREKLVLVSPHNDNIEEEFGEAFRQWHKARYGSDVELVWRDVGGGGSKIVEYLTNVYERSDTSEIDIVWGGGDYYFLKLADAGVLQPMELPKEYVEQTPAVYGGLELYDKDKKLWAGAAMGGFGILYNRTLLNRLHAAPPKLWDDLGDKRFYGLVALADPTQSSSAATAYEMIVQSAADWPSGWAKLMAVLGNSQKFYDGASGAADAVISEAPVATCIDFYGFMRVDKYPADLNYVSPKGQTAFNADPIGILKNPPHPELAQRFVDFVLSKEGQALWAVEPGKPGGPRKHRLMRQPIRKDVYAEYGEDFTSWITNPYAEGSEMKLDVEMRNTRFPVLRAMVKAAAIDNASALRQARKKLIDSGFDAAMLAEYNQLPPDVRTAEQIREVSQKLRDKTEAEKITTDWQRFFRDKYARIAG